MGSNLSKNVVIALALAGALGLVVTRRVVPYLVDQASYTDGEQVWNTTRGEGLRYAVWKPAQALEGAVNTPAHETRPALSADGRWLVFGVGEPGQNAELYLARMVAAKQGSLTFPLKWFTIAQCFRYERTTRGRKREHFQWNLDIVGEPSLHAEAEIIAAAVDGMATMGLGASDIVIDFSNRAMLSDILSNLGIEGDDHAAAFVALDKRGKIPDDQIKGILGAYGLSDDRVGKVFDVLGIQSMDDVAAVLPADCESYQDLLRFVDLMDTYGLAAHMHFNIGVIRGLAYYTGIVFEAFDAGRELRAVFGGGRYDNLLSSIGGAPATAVGLGFGDVVIGELLAMKREGDATPSRGGVLVGYMQEAQRLAAIRVAGALRADGQNVDLALSPEKAKKFFPRCNKGGYNDAVYIGPDDLAAGTVRIKDLATREEREMAL